MDMDQKLDFDFVGDRINTHLHCERKVGEGEKREGVGCEGWELIDALNISC